MNMNAHPVAQEGDFNSERENYERTVESLAHSALSSFPDLAKGDPHSGHTFDAAVKADKNPNRYQVEPRRVRLERFALADAAHDERRKRELAKVKGDDAKAKEVNRSWPPLPSEVAVKLHKEAAAIGRPEVFLSLRVDASAFKKDKEAWSEYLKAKDPEVALKDKPSGTVAVKESISEGYRYGAKAYVVNWMEFPSTQEAREYIERAGENVEDPRSHGNGYDETTREVVVKADQSQE